MRMIVTADDLQSVVRQASGCLGAETDETKWILLPVECKPRRPGGTGGAGTRTRCDRASYVPSGTLKVR